MKRVTLHDKVFDQWLDEASLKNAISSVAQDITRDLSTKKPVFVAVLNGVFRFASDLFSQLDFDCEIEFIKLASYKSTESTGKIDQLIGLRDSLEGRTVVLLEDIIDTGLTISNAVNCILAHKPAELKVATLFLKPDVYKGALQPDYVGMSIANTFIVGYGMDYDGLGRNLNSIYKLNKQKDMLNIVLFGPPGAGKGTQSEHLVQKYQLVHLSTGDIFRANIKGETELGLMAKQFMDKGQLVPDKVTIGMLKAKMAEYPSAKGFIFDGFPRTIPQADALEQALADQNTDVSMMLALEVEEKELRNRLAERAKSSGRVDDANPEVIQKRINVYNQETAPVADFYKKQNKYHGIDGIGSIKEIADRLCGTIDELKQKA